MNKFCNTGIEVGGRGTLAVMKWIKENKYPSLEQSIFTHLGKPFLIVSDVYPEEIDALLLSMELDNREWDEFPGGLKRITNQVTDQMIAWNFLIDGHYYFATNY